MDRGFLNFQLLKLLDQSMSKVACCGASLHDGLARHAGTCTCVPVLNDLGEMFSVRSCLT